MRSIIITLLIGIAAFCVSCSEKYLSQGTLSAYKPYVNYKVALMPPIFKNINESSNLQSLIYSKVKAEISEITNIAFVGDLSTIKTSLNSRKIGASDYEDASLYKQVAQDLGCNAYIKVVLSREDQKKPVLAEVEIFEVATDMTIYVGRGRGINPASVEAESELAVQLALNQLKQSTKKGNKGYSDLKLEDIKEGDFNKEKVVNYLNQMAQIAYQKSSKTIDTKILGDENSNLELKIASLMFKEAPSDIEEKLKTAI